MPRPSQSLLVIALLLLAVAGASAQTFLEYSIPTTNAVPEAMVNGSDGAVWFLEKTGNKVGRVSVTGAFSEFAVPTSNAQPAGGITNGPDRAIWFTEDGVNKIGRVSLSGTITEFTVPTAASAPSGIVSGADGNLWFTENTGNKVGRLSPGGSFSEFPIPTAASAPVGITLGPDNALWFTEYDKSKIGRSTTAGAITEFVLPNSGSGPIQITTGPDGNLWFTEDGGARIGRMSVTGTLAEFPVPGATALRGIISGPDGNLYFSLPLQSKIGKITVGGTVTLFNTPSLNAFPTFMAVGQDGNIWFAETTVNRIAVMLLNAPEQMGILPAVASANGSNGSFFRTSLQIHNPNNTGMAGHIVFHQAGATGSSSDPTLNYSLLPLETKAFTDFVNSMGQSGLGSADIISTSGGLPTVVARVYNDAGDKGTTGFTEDFVKPENALAAGDRFTLLVPADLFHFRYNIGVRTLTASQITVTVRNSDGTLVRSVSKSYPANYFEQLDSPTFLGGSPSGSDSIAVQVESGTLFIYGATTDNTTQDPSIQLGRK